MTGQPTVDLDELRHVLTSAAQQPGCKQLFCAADVAGRLTAELPAAGPPEPPGSPFHDAGIIGRLLAVDIITTPDAAPGTFRLVRHYDPTGRRVTCAVHGDRVSHLGCPVVLEGVLTP